LYAEREPVEEATMVDTAFSAELKKCIGQLSADRALLVLEFARPLAEEDKDHPLAPMLASEMVLARDWLRPEEEAA
jgi:hypothetical protein